MPRIPFSYRFHAHGHALGGDFHLPVWSPIEAQASASLPTIGGHASARSQNFFHQEFVSFRSAHTHVSGRRLDDGTYVTHTSTVIEGLNIRDTVTADRIVGRLTSTRSPKSAESHIVADDARFEGLRIAGYDVKVILRHELLVRNKTAADLSRAVSNDKKSERIAYVKDKVTVCSLVESLDTRLPGVHPKKHIIEVKDFGKISIAELFVNQCTRTFTMLRLELGSPTSGNMTVAEAVINGQPMPPVP
jgi:hypothetical protein